MILNIDKHKENSLAVIDSAGEKLTYGELTEFSKELKRVLPSRSLVFVLAGNDVGGIAWSIGLLEAGLVPLLLNPKIDPELLERLDEIYEPRYVCLSNRDSGRFDFERKLICFNYSLLKTGKNN